MPGFVCMTRVNSKNMGYRICQALSQLEYSSNIGFMKPRVKQTNPPNNSSTHRLKIHSILLTVFASTVTGGNTDTQTTQSYTF